MAITAAQLSVKISADGADQAQQKIAGVGNSVTDTSKKITALAGGALAAGAVALVGIGVASTKMAADFQTGVTSLVTGAGESASNLKSVSDGILQMAVDTGTSTKQLTDGMYMIESAGYHGAQGLAVLQAAAEGAKVGNADLGTVANAVTTVMHDYASSNIDATQATNGLITTVAQGKTHMQDLAGSLSTVLPLASSLHIPFEQVAGATAVMTNAGMGAQQATQNLAFAIRSMNVESGPGAKSLTAIGASASQLHDILTTQGLPAALQYVEDAIGKKWPLGSMEGQQALKNIMGGVAGLNVALMLTGPHMTEFTGDISAIGASVHSASKDVQGWSDVTATFNFKLEQAKEVVETLGIKIGTALLPIVGKLLDQLTPAITGFGNWIIKSGVLTDAANTLVSGLKKLSDSITNITTYLGKHNDALNLAKIGALALAGAVVGVMTPGIIAATASFLALDVAALPWIALAAAIGAAVALLVVGFISLYNNSKPVRDFFVGMGPAFSGVGAIFKLIWNDVVSNFIPAWKDLSKAFQGLMPDLQIVGEILGGVLLVAIGLVIGAVAGLAKGIGYAVAGIVNIFQGLVEFLTGAFDFVGGIFLVLMDLITGHFSDLGPDLMRIVTGIVEMFKGFADVLGGIFMTLAGFVVGLISGFVETIVKFFQGLYDDLVGHSIIPDLINGIISWFAQLPGRVGDWVSKMVTTVIAWINQLPGKMLDMWNTIKNDIGITWNYIFTMIQNKAGDIFNGIMKPFNNARDAIGGVIRSFVNNAVDVLNNGIQAVENFVNFFGTGIDDIAGALNAGSPVPHITLNRIPHYATGTDSHPGGPAVVGENGRELVFLPKGAKVAPNHITEMLLGMSGGKVPGYAGGIGDIAGNIMNWIAGGAKSVIDNLVSSLNISVPNLGGMTNIASALFKKVEDWAVSWVSKILPQFGATGPGGTPVNIPGNLQSWITQAMALAGAPASWATDLGIIAMHESGGNPNAINLTDSNALAGHPSQGIMQTIPSTFAAYALPGYGNILSPVDNIIAGIRYIMSRYGDVFHVPGIESLAAGNSYIGYSGGTDYAPGGMAMVGEQGPELMYVPRGARIVPNSRLTSGSQGGTTIVVNPPAIYLDGRLLANGLMPYIVDGIRYSTGVRS